MDTYWSNLKHEIYEIFYYYYKSIRNYFKRKKRVLSEYGLLRTLKKLKSDILLSLRFLLPFSNMSKEEKKAVLEIRDLSEGLASFCNEIAKKLNGHV
jgi:hypothetical protein